MTATVMGQNFFRTWDLFGYPQQVRCGRSRARSELAQVEDHPLIIIRAAAQTEATGKGRVPLSDPAPATSTTTRPLSGLHSQHRPAPLRTQGAVRELKVLRVLDP